MDAMVRFEDFSLNMWKPSDFEIGLEQGRVLVSEVVDIGLVQLVSHVLHLFHH
jgi:hypothetical protein